MKPIFASLLLVAACSHNPLDPGAGNDPGRGTSTLVVTGNATAQPRITNASNPADFDTDFSVHISLNGQPVTTGTVDIKSKTITVPLTFNNTTNNTGRWEGTAAGYDEVYQLDVISGADSVEGVIVDGPDIHVITAPTAGMSLDSTMAFTTTWNRIDHADVCEFSVGDRNGLVIDDTGSYMVAPGSLHANQGEAVTNTLRITRSSRVTPAGGAAGSEFQVGVENEVDVVALPCPTC